MSAGQVLTFVVVSAVVIIAAYYATYFLASRSAKRNTGRGRDIRVIDRFALSKDKSVCLVEVKDRVYVIAFSAHGATLIDTRYSEEFSQDDDTAEYTPTQQRYEPQGMIQKALYGIYSFVKNSMNQNKKSKTAAAPPVSPRSRGETAKATQEDDLDLVFRRLQNKKAGDGITIREQEKDE